MYIERPRVVRPLCKSIALPLAKQNKSLAKTCNRYDTVVLCLHLANLADFIRLILGFQSGVCVCVHFGRALVRVGS